MQACAADQREAIAWGGSVHACTYVRRCKRCRKDVRCILGGGQQARGRSNVLGRLSGLWPDMRMPARTRRCACAEVCLRGNQGGLVMRSGARTVAYDPSCCCCRCTFEVSNAGIWCHGSSQSCTRLANKQVLLDKQTCPPTVQDAAACSR